MDNTVFAFGPFRLHSAERLLLKENKPVRLGSRALEILITLVERAGEMVLKGQLIDRVWPDAMVDEAALRVHVAGLRKASRRQAGRQPLRRKHPGARLQLRLASRARAAAGDRYGCQASPPASAIFRHS